MKPILQTTDTTRLFGIPIGGFGAFGTVLISAAVAAMTFFVATFLSIFGIMIYNGAGHHVTYADSYRWIGLPAAIIVLLVSLMLLGSLWFRRKFGGRTAR